MKKRIASIVLGVLMTCVAGCGTQNSNQIISSDTTADETTAADTQADQSEQTTQQETTKAFDGVDTLSLYIYNQETGYREISTGCESTWVEGEDIVSFEAYATDTERFTLSGSNFKNVWESYWTQFENNEKCKIGYIVDFTLQSGERIKKTILGPDDVFSYRNYLECYLYDDVNQVQGNWYSHLLDTEVTDATEMTSIKFTAGVDIEQLGDTITLTAFVYSSEDDFDEEGNYTGPVTYTVTVKNTAQ